MTFYIFRALLTEPWAQALVRLEAACLVRDSAEVAAAYTELYAALAEAGHADLAEAAATALLYAPSPLASAVAAHPIPPEGLLSGGRCDLEGLLERVRRDWQRDAADILGQDVPPLTLGPGEGRTSALAQQLRTTDSETVLDALLGSYRQNGTGPLARFPAFRWSGGALHGVSHPAWTEAGRLVGVEAAVARLRANTEAFLAGRGAQHVLLYGPRGSGKSTALRSLGGHYAADGLRFVEVSPEQLTDLPHILEQLRGRPHHYLLFVDDLAFEGGGSGYGPLKSLLEGSLGGRPDNVLVSATSNRRHLVAERFSDRPDPLNDDVHAWDTQHERLALSDRFGLVITFPDATQRRYLEIVRTLAARDGLAAEQDGAELEHRAVRFAEWGNGYSGRTAQQFLEALRSGLV